MDSVTFVLAKSCHSCFNYNLQNFGRTPPSAWMRYVRLDCSCADSDTPDYGVGGSALIPLPQGSPNDKMLKLPVTLRSIK